MATVVLSPHPMELGLHREQYDSLLAELHEQGHRVRLERPIEQRGVLSDAAVQACDLAVQLHGAVEEETVRAIAAALVAYLIGSVRTGPRKGKPRTAVIYDHRGEKLREIELPVDGAE